MNHLSKEQRALGVVPTVRTPFLAAAIIAGEQHMYGGGGVIETGVFISYTRIDKTYIITVCVYKVRLSKGIQHSPWTST